MSLHRGWLMGGLMIVGLALSAVNLPTGVFGLRSLLLFMLLAGLAGMGGTWSSLRVRRQRARLEIPVKMPPLRELLRGGGSPIQAEFDGVIVGTGAAVGLLLGKVLWANTLSLEGATLLAWTAGSGYALYLFMRTLLEKE